MLILKELELGNKTTPEFKHITESCANLITMLYSLETDRQGLRQNMINEVIKIHKLVAKQTI